MAGTDRAWVARRSAAATPAIALAAIATVAIALPAVSLTAVSLARDSLAAPSFVAGPATYVDPRDRFSVPVPAGWMVAAGVPEGAVTFVHPDPPGFVHVLAVEGHEIEVVASALELLVDPDLDEHFALAPLEITPLTLPTGAWTRRVYQHGEELVVVVTAERHGTTYLVVARGTVESFARAVDAGAATILLGIELAPLGEVVGAPG